MATLLVMALKEESQGFFESRKVTPHYCGVGQVKAAFLTHKLILEKKPSRVINLGTAGSYRFKQGTLVECTSFVQRIANNFHPMRAKTLTTEALTDLQQAVCGTSDFIEKDKGITECDVMDMEAYAIAYVCQQLNVKFTSIKYVSDNSDDDFMKDWQSHLKTSAEKLYEQYHKIAGIQ